jgi:hypothetical protein
MAMTGGVSLPRIERGSLGCPFLLVGRYPLMAPLAEI